ncbi:MAG: hypothetical protein V1845_00870 [bacterium]
MNSRQRKILYAIIREHQKTGQPVASQVLVERYNFDLSPATIRSEMLALDEEELLLQPHHSAGRVPTTKAYRFLVDRLLKERESYMRGQEQLRKNFERVTPGNMFFYQVAQMLATFSNNLGMSGFFGQGESDFHEAGLASLLSDSELCRPESVIDILRGFEEMERKFTDFFGELNGKTKVFIGEENPIDDFERCSLVISGYKTGAKKGFIGILGPKRMNYARNIFLVEETKKVIENS